MAIPAALTLFAAAFSANWADGEPPQQAEREAHRTESTADAAADAPSAVAPDDAGDDPALSAPELLRNARRRLLNYRSVKAGLIETVVIGGRKFRAAGTYLQGPDLKLKMSLQLSLGDGGRYRASMLQVCDGQVLWTAHRFGRGKKGAKDDEGVDQQVTRRDVKQILREAARHKELPSVTLFAELGLGGISELLSSLQQSMAFGKVRSRQIDGKPFLVVQGRWNFGVLRNFLEEPELEELRSGGEIRRLPRLPEHVPDMVRLYIERDSLFPRRILYLKRPELSDTLQPMLSLNFVDVVLNPPVDENDFVFAPPDKVYPQDVTPKYIKQIRQAAKEAKSRK